MHNSLVEKGTAPSGQANENKTRNLAIKAELTKSRAATQSLLNMIYESKYIESILMEFDSIVVTAIVVLFYWKKIVYATRYANDITLAR